MNVDHNQMEKENVAGEMFFNGVRLRIVEAYIQGQITDPYWCDTYNKGRGKAGRWTLEFVPDIEGTEFEKDGLSIGLEEIYFDGMPETGTQVEWTAPYHPKSGEIIGKVFTWDTAEIRRGKLSIIERRGNVFQIEFEGMDWRRHEIRIKATAMYGGIGMGYSELDSRKEILKRASDCFDITGLEMIMDPLDNQYESGVKMGTVYFVPKEVLESHPRPGSG